MTRCLRLHAYVTSETSLSLWFPMRDQDQTRKHFCRTPERFSHVRQHKLSGYSSAFKGCILASEPGLTFEGQRPYRRVAARSQERPGYFDSPVSDAISMANREVARCGVTRFFVGRGVGVAGQGSSRHFGSADPPSAPVWIACQLTEAFPWDEAPRHLIRDRDRVYGAVVTSRLRAMGIRDKLTASPGLG